MTLTWKQALRAGVPMSLLLSPVPVWAEETTTGPEVIVLDDVTVTARRIEESAQDIPVAVTTITADEILDADVDTMDDISRLVPSFSFAKGSQSRYSTYNIRGVGSLVPGGFEDGSVSAYVDGVPIPLSLMDDVYTDLERIEVLRGPQGTLYGKNAQAGAINITTLGPSEQFEGEIGFDVGTEGQREVRAMVGTPLIEDRLAIRLSANASSRDGLVYNEALGRDTGDFDRVSGSATIDANWSERVQTRLSLRHEVIDNGDNQMVPADRYNTTNEPFDAYNDQTVWFGGMTNTIALADGLDLKLITGGAAIDGTEHYSQSVFQHSLADYNEYQFSQEVRLDGVTEDFTWSAGAFYSLFHQNQTMDGLGAMELKSTGDHDTDSQAVFGEVTYALTETVKLTGGLRLHRTHVETDETVVHHTFGFTHSYDDEDTFLGWNGRVALTYLPTDTDTLFASVARAYKPGGFQTAHANAITGLQEPTTGYGAATTLTYEVGYKGQFFDRRLSFDATAFFSETSDEQVVGYDPVTFAGRYSNIDTQAYGLELGSRWRATRELTLGGSLALTRAYAAQDGDLGWNGLVEKGDDLPNTPLLAYTLFADYRDDLPFGPAGTMWFARADFAHSGERWGEATNTNRIPESDILNLSLGFEADSYRVVGYVNNALDDEVVDFAAFGRSRPGASRQFGVRGSLFF
ncbi:TonB-dependent receptor [Rhodospira trueperi]|uniref:Iron complex outermembrane recepter protein n=1 Tax=Rhodospira trueperi TaxID=69960 RepID=A0A1G7DJ60_9PROT|nr:TonB-dependent receptor [Rhodospira trueperi]SDE51574.1 iron complex outermembrane recepter protein [Rhodospira trueperi]